jgi:hypothetical protein
MAADDLVYAERSGHPIPGANCIQKISTLSSNILIGSAGLMIHPEIDYEYENWISSFITAHETDLTKRPSDIATALETRMRNTMKPIESGGESGFWMTHRIGERIVTYIVAGYAESFHQPYLFEFGAEINQDGTGLHYVQPIRHRDSSILVGEDESLTRAQQGLDPEYSARESILAEVTVNVHEYLPQIPISMQEAVASVVSFIKVEARFNPQKVGNGVRLGLIDRKKRDSYTAVF